MRTSALAELHHVNMRTVQGVQSVYQVGDNGFAGPMLEKAQMHMRTVQ